MRFMKSITKILLIVFVFTLIAGFTACGGNSEQDDTNNTADLQETTPVPDAALTDASVIGSWKDVNAADRFTKITKTDTGYEYEDNEGKYPATFESGILKVQVGGTDTANAFFDAKSKNLIVDYQGSISRFSK